MNRTSKLLLGLFVLLFVLGQAAPALAASDSLTRATSPNDVGEDPVFKSSSDAKNDDGGNGDRDGQGNDDSDPGDDAGDSGESSAGSGGNSGESDDAGDSGGSNAGDSGNSGESDDAGSSGNSGESDNAGNSGNSGESDNAGNSGNSGESDNAGNSGEGDSAGNGGNSGASDEAGNAANATGDDTRTAEDSGTGNIGSSGGADESGGGEGEGDAGTDANAPFSFLPGPLEDVLTGDAGSQNASNDATCEADSDGPFGLFGVLPVEIPTGSTCDSGSESPPASAGATSNNGNGTPTDCDGDPGREGVQNESSEGGDCDGDADNTKVGPNATVSLTEEEVMGNDDAEFVADWQVETRSNDSLATVELELVDDDDGDIEDTTTVDVEGRSANGTTQLNASDEDGAGHEYTVTLNLTYENRDDTATATDSAVETENLTANVVEVTEVETGENATFSVDWNATDADGGLDYVLIELEDRSDGEMEEMVMNESVGGDAASGTTLLNATDDDGSGNSYTVNVTAHDETDYPVTASEMIDETEPGGGGSGTTTTDSSETTTTDSGGTTTIDGDDDDDATTTTDASPSAPTVERLSLSEREAADGVAEFVVDWKVEDGDGDLVSVDLVLYDRSGDMVAGAGFEFDRTDSRSGTTRLNVSGADGLGERYTVELIAADDGSPDPVSQTASLTENGLGGVVAGGGGGGGGVINQTTPQPTPSAGDGGGGAGIAATPTPTPSPNAAGNDDPGQGDADSDTTTPGVEVGGGGTAQFVLLLLLLALAVVLAARAIQRYGAE